MSLKIAQIRETILEDYRLPLEGMHGVAHWGRVFENGVRLAEVTDAQLEVVQLFAILHDSCRQSETYDPDHGPRAAEYASRLRGKLFELPDAEFELLYQACYGHTHERTHRDITIQTCWDADRLDLGRVGIIPDPAWLSTDIARTDKMINWAHGRAAMDFIPERVTLDWGIQLEG